MNAGKFKAFTIIELMTVVVIVALLITAAIPGYQSFIQNNQAVSITNRLTAALRLAKAESIKLGVSVGVCPVNPDDISIDYVSGTTDIGGDSLCDNTATSWDAWQVYTSDTTIQLISDIPAGIVTTVDANNTSTITTGPILFDSMGFADIQGNNAYVSSEQTDSDSDYAAFFRTFIIKPKGCSGNNARTVEVAQNGSITVTRASCD